VVGKLAEPGDTSLVTSDATNTSWCDLLVGERSGDAAGKDRYP
jgi:hypothetical protein